MQQRRYHVFWSTTDLLGSRRILRYRPPSFDRFSNHGQARTVFMDSSIPADPVHDCANVFLLNYFGKYVIPSDNHEQNWGDLKLIVMDVPYYVVNGKTGNVGIWKKTPELHKFALSFKCDSGTYLATVNEDKLEFIITNNVKESIQNRFNCWFQKEYAGLTDQYYIQTASNTSKKYLVVKEDIALSDDKPMDLDSIFKADHSYQCSKSPGCTGF